ncbi:MAG: 3-phosphoshikimate 1-carboxyvinyltransferase [Dysgonamonadaceae bacterium]|jgi:3-phosphoshikimate 1-carboxyvinyltransferase|nr:3-phosphoshikimate 1-carboxyvinyltransferase [Dysgonamonadaceae bacterium]
MIYTLTAPSSINSVIHLPASKSISNRVLILNALSSNPYPVDNLSDSDDTKALLKAMESKAGFINAGAGGTTMRFLTAYLAQLPGEYTITGTERMKNRPVNILVEALRQAGAEIEYIEKEGFPPLKIKGKSLNGGEVYLNGGVSSQYISALMMIAPRMKRGLRLHIEGNAISRPYIQMTKRLMENFGIEIQWEGSSILVEYQSYKPIPFRVESDWSAASYWYEIMALSDNKASVELAGLESDSLQGDSIVAQLFEELKTIKGIFSHDFTHTPDLAQTMVVSCCMLNIPFHFTGLQSLKIKETDRILALKQEMKKLGYILKDESDSIIKWTGEKCQEENNPVISTYEDHRMAMAFAPVCLKTKAVRIQNPEVVSKSYPNFWNDLKKAGFAVNEELDS